MSIWCTFLISTNILAIIYVQWWRRRNKFLMVKWNMINFSYEEPLRPGWKHDKLGLSTVTGKLEPYFSSAAQTKVNAVSWTFISIMVIIMLVVVESYVFYNAMIASFLENNYPEIKYYAPFTSAAISLIASILLSYFSRFLSKSLTEKENHKKASSHQDSVISKFMLFDFINFYGTLFYIALVKKWVQEGGLGSFSGINVHEECLYRNCMLELTIQMVIL